MKSDKTPKLDRRYRVLRWPGDECLGIFEFSGVCGTDGVGQLPSTLRAFSVMTIILSLSIFACFGADLLSRQKLVRRLELVPDSPRRVATASENDPITIAFLERLDTQSILTIERYTTRGVDKIAEVVLPWETKRHQILQQGADYLICYDAMARPLERAVTSARNDYSVFCMNVSGSPGSASRAKKVIDNVIEFTLIDGGALSAFAIVASTGPNHAMRPRISINFISGSLSVESSQIIDTLSAEQEIERRGQAFDVLRIGEYAIVSFSEQIGKKYFTRSVVINYSNGYTKECSERLELSGRDLFWGRPLLMGNSSGTRFMYVRGFEVIGSMELEGGWCSILGDYTLPGSRWSDDTLSEVYPVEDQ